jgi:GAF domain-containing protein
VEVIQERFQLYYVGLFLVDEHREAIVLRAGTGEAGRKMLSRGHQLALGQGMIGWSVENDQARVSLDVDEDLEQGVRVPRFANPDLPNTRSEAAIPLRARGRVIGALTVQDDQPGAFDEEVVDLLQVMADLLATTIENARLYSETQGALEGAQRAYGRMTREGWMRLLRDRPTGYRVSERGDVEALSGVWKRELQEASRTGRTVQSNSTLAVPVTVRGETLGAVQLEKGDSDWSEREVSLVATVIDQLGIALDSARLYEDTQQSAARERVARQITDRMRTTLDWDDLMQTAVQEIGQAVQASRVFVQWLPPRTAQMPPRTAQMPQQPTASQNATADLPDGPEAS